MEGAVSKMKRLSLPILLALVAVLVLAPISSAWAGNAHGKMKADTVMVNGKIITVDRHDSVAQAVAIRDGRILAVGDNWKMAKYLGHSTTVINLHGRTATPGMIDSHVHFSGTRSLFILDLGPLKVHNIADVQAAVQAQCDLQGPDTWVQGAGWGVSYLAEQRPLYAADIDPVSSENPVFLRETSGHQGVANSIALAMAHIDAQTPDPPGGFIDRDAYGNPTGLLKETATSLVTSLIPPFTGAQNKQGLEFVCDQANSVGLTSILYPGIADSTWQLFNEVKADGNLTVRAAMLWSSGRTVDATNALIAKVKPITHPYSKDDDMLWSQGIKIVFGGVQDASTQWSWYPHWPSYFTPPTEPYWYGLPGWDPNVVREQIRLYHNAGLQVQVHCCGDREQDWILGSYQAAEEANPIYGLRHGIIHADTPTDWALKMMPKWQKKLDYGYTYTNPDFMWWTEIIANSMGPIESLREMPLKTYLKTGNLFGFGSDFGVDPLDPKYSIWSAMTRDTLMGNYGPHPFGTTQCINVHDALRAMTRSNAYLLFMEDKIGSIEKGKYADIAIWDKNWYKATTDEIKNINCEMTLLGGKIVYQANATPVTVSQGEGL